MVNLTTSEWHAILLADRVPLIVSTAMLFLIGFIGNLLVILVYKFRMKSSSGRYFIPFLAMADISAVTVTSCFMMVMDFTEGVFPSDQMCKAFQFLNWSTTQASIFLLFVIAVHRFLMVCRPLNTRFTIQWRRVAIGSSVVVAYLLGIPLLAFSGRVSLTLVYKNATVTGDLCTFNPGNNKLGEAIYYNILFVGNILLLFATTSLYLPVGKVIFNKYKKQAKLKGMAESSEACSTALSGSTEDGTTNTMEITSSETTSIASSKVFSVTLPSNQNLSKKNSTSNLNDLNTVSRRQREKPSSGDAIRGKFTLTLMLVVVFYVISYIPFYVIISTGVNDPTTWFNMAPWKLNGNLFLYRCYMINNVVNPIIYGMFDSTFRHHLLGLCRAF